MEETKMIFLALTVVGGLFAIVAMAMWGQKRAEEAKSWPTTEATVQSAETELVNLGGRSKVYLPCCAFSYVVDGDYYSGRFGLSEGNAPFKALIDRKLTIHYNPKRPSSFHIPNDMIEGCRVVTIPD